MSKLIVDRDFLEEPLTGVEFAVFLSVGDLGTVYREEYIAYDLTVYYNMAGKLPNQKQRIEVNDAMLKLIDEGYLVGEAIGRGIYLINCKQSFYYDLEHLPHGGALVVFDDIRKIVSSGRSWQGMLRYYLILLSHMRNNKKCTFSRQYFSEKIGISELTLSKYNTDLVNLGVLEIMHRKNSSNVYDIKHGA